GWSAPATCCFRPATGRYRRASWRTGSSPTTFRSASSCSWTSCCGTTSRGGEDGARWRGDAPRPPTTDGTPMTDAGVLLSGGMDSAVVLAIAREQGFAVHALSVRYGQRHTSELDAAADVASMLGAAAHKTVAVDLRALGGSALTDDAIEVPTDADGHVI